MFFCLYTIFHFVITLLSRSLVLILVCKFATLLAMVPLLSLQFESEEKFSKIPYWLTTFGYGSKNNYGSTQCWVHERLHLAWSLIHKYILVNGLVIETLNTVKMGSVKHFARISFLTTTEMPPFLILFDVNLTVTFTILLLSFLPLSVLIKPLQPKGEVWAPISDCFAYLLLYFLLFGQSIPFFY